MPTGLGSRYVLVWLKSGGSTELTQEERAVALEGHFANMGRLFDERFLLMAGPLGEPRSDPRDRGIFVFDVDEVEEADALTATDPAVQAGVFVFDAHPFEANDPLRTLFELEEDNEEGLDGMRMFVVARSPHAERADAAVASLVAEGMVTVSGRLGGGREATGLYVVNAETVDEARQMLIAASGEQDLEWDLSPWFGSKTLERLGRTTGSSP
ncbi:MAG: YciI family protein [Acidobacteriota bacterium]